MMVGSVTRDPNIKPPSHEAMEVIGISNAVAAVVGCGEHRLGDVARVARDVNPHLDGHLDPVAIGTGYEGW
jgi:hypothetical protein